jgi:uncharacterized protein (UPF0548 family)
VPLATLWPDTLARLDAVLPANWSHGNPVDIIGDAPAQRYVQALEALASDPGSRHHAVHPRAHGHRAQCRHRPRLVPLAAPGRPPRRAC